VTDDVESQITASRNGGQPLPASERAFFEPRFGYQFDHVKVHTDHTANNLARDLGARAFTTGRDIYFQQGEYQPGSSAGRELLAHELTHVVQQQPPTLNRSVLQRDEEEAESPFLDPMEGLVNLLHNMVEWKAVPFINHAEKVRPKYDNKLKGLSQRFESAWKLQEPVLQAAEERAENENLVKGVLIGAGASLLIATGVGAIPALAELAAFSGGWWALQGASAVASSAVGTGAATAVATPTGFRSSLPSNLMEMERLKGLLKFERELTKALTGAFNISRIYIRADFILDQLYDPGRFGTTTDEAEEEAAQFLSREEAVSELWSTWTRVSEWLTSFESQVDALKIPSQKVFLEAIWVHWIKSLNEADHDKLDNDEIEDHLIALGVLGSSGFLGVDTAKLFDTDEEILAIRRARSRWPLMEKRLSTP